VAGDYEGSTWSAREEAHRSEFPGSDLSEEEWRFGKFMHMMKIKEKKPWPHYTDILRWAKMLGYRLVEKQDANPSK
jgi:hypothetical protein